MSPSIPPVQRAKSNLQSSTLVGVGLEMSSSDVNSTLVTSFTNKKEQNGPLALILEIIGSETLFRK